MAHHLHYEYKMIFEFQREGERFMIYTTKRAVQFMPFNGLRGFSEQLVQAECPEVERREITEDHANVLNQKIQKLYKNETIVLTRYTANGYINQLCCVKEVDCTFRLLRTDCGNISFADIWDIDTGA